MSLDVVIGLIGVIVTILVVVGMILITPRGVDSSQLPAEPPSSNDVVDGDGDPARTALSSTTNVAIRRVPAPTDARGLGSRQTRRQA
jgi:hypothetical protein